MAYIKKSIPIIDRFMSYVNKTEECWEWTGFLNPVTKRPYFRMNGHRFTSSKCSYLLFNGDVGDKHVLHTCDNRKCVNPGHLFLGTNQDNINDMIKKKRHCFGEKRKNHKLKDKDVIDIKSMCSKRYYEHKEIAKMYNVSVSLITKVLNNNRWKHLSAEV